MEICGVWCVAMFLLGAGQTYAEITQTPSVVLERKRTAYLRCKQNNGHENMFWYRQNPRQGQGLQFLFFFQYREERERDANFSHFKANRAQDDVLYLNISSVEPDDSAVYFCATSPFGETNQPLNFGEGTRLTVLEDGLNITEPEVAIFAPSQKEIKEKKKATLVCVATGFYPDHIKVTWKVNGGERTEGVGTDEHATRDNQTKMYSLTSRLRIPSQEWFNPKNNFQCLVSFYGKDPTPKRYPKAIQGVAGCSVTEELYQRSSRTGYFVYLMLFFKSILYGLFVMGLILRSKKMH